MNATDTPYNPRSEPDRRHLADALVAMLRASGFVQRPGTGATMEQVWDFDCNSEKAGRNRSPNTYIAVYTSVIHGSVRAVDADAIRVVGLYRASEARDRPLRGDIRVNRTGSVEGIVSRVQERMRGAFRAIATGERCRHCGAPLFETKAKKLACAAICWERRPAQGGR